MEIWVGDHGKTRNKEWSCGDAKDKENQIRFVSQRHSSVLTLVSSSISSGRSRGWGGGGTDGQSNSEKETSTRNKTSDRTADYDVNVEV